MSIRWYEGICRQCKKQYRGHGKYYCSVKCYLADPLLLKKRIESRMRTKRNFILETKEWFEENYTKRKNSMKGLSEESGHSFHLIRKWLKIYKIPIRTSWGVLSGKYSGEKSAAWKGGRWTSGGYVYIYSPNHPRKVKTIGSKSGGYMAEHRLVMEKHIGRYLYPWETVHHINGIKDDNRIENLKLLPSSAHNTKVQEVYQENIKLRLLLAAIMQTKGAI